MSNRAQALQVIRRLRQKGFEALLAGGCVRDRLLGRTASDYDVATDAIPSQVVGLFARTLKIGAKFGVVMILLEGKQVEVATFRTESGYCDGRRPGRVDFVSAKEDASRRDFTVNGMFYDPLDKKLLDFVGGRADLEARILRTIGDPDRRFSEDYLRMLRAVRFAVKLEFAIEPATWRSIRTHAAKISRISAERIAAELEMIVAHPDRCRGVELLFASGLAQAIFAPFDAAACRAARQTTAHLPRAVHVTLAMAALCAGLSAATAMTFCRGLKLSNAALKHIGFLLTHRGALRDPQIPLSRLKRLMHEPYFADLLVFERAIIKAEGGSLRPLAALKKRAAGIDPACVHPEPLLDGHALIALGAAPGPMVGRLAQELYTAQLEESLKTPRQAEKWAVQWLAARRQEESAGA